MAVTGPKTRVFADGIAEIRRKLETGILKPGQLLGSEYAFAREAGVSRMSVRRAIDELISEGHLERRPGRGIYVRDSRVARRTVQFVIGTDTWDPWMLAHGQLQSASKSVMAGAWDPWLPVARGAQQYGRSRSMQIQICDAHGEVDLDLSMLRALPESGVAGAIIVSVHRPEFNEALFVLKEARFPFVLVDQRLREMGVPSVTADNYDGGYQVGRELFALGHHRIAFIGDLQSNTNQDRLNGLRDAINDSGIPFDRRLVIDLASDPKPTRDIPEEWPEKIGRVLAELMGRENRPTAIFAASDVLAAMVLRSLTGMGIRVPADLSVVGFDDALWSAFTSPPLASVSQPLFEIGQAAVEMLLKRMQDPDAAPETLTLPTQWVPRGSIGPAPRS